MATKTHTLLVLDPKNSDATFGVPEEAEIWVCKDGEGRIWHTGQALEEGRVVTRTLVMDLVDAAKAVIENKLGGGPDIQVVRTEDLALLQQLLEGMDDSPDTTRSHT